MSRLIHRANPPRAYQRQLQMCRAGDRQVQPAWALCFHYSGRIVAVVSQGAERSSHVTDPATASHKLPQQKPLSAAQQQKMYDRGFRKFPSVIQTMDEAASAQPEALQSVDFHHEATAIQADSGAPSEDEEDFEEREDDRANDPACIQCDDGGEFLNVA